MNIKYLPKFHLLTPEDLHLYEFPQVFSTSAVWLEKGMDQNVATYDLVIRDLPKNRNFMLVSGIEEIIQQILKWRYSEDEVEYLKNLGIITENFADYLKNFRFTGDVYAMPEGTVFFPGEPVIRITAPIIEGNLITLLLINGITSNTIFLTKFIRSVLVAQGKMLIGPGGIRGHSFESGMKASRAAYITGFRQVLPAFYRKYKLQISQRPIVIAYHAFIKSFPTELEAMRAITEVFQDVSLMIDTYDIDKGLENAITIAKGLEKDSRKLAAVIIDSGDLYKLAKKVRNKLDAVGLQYVKINVASNLDEYKIKELIEQKTPADGFIVATEAVTSADAPKLETVYKMAEMRSENGIQYLAKLTPGKLSLPGRKQVFRTYKNGKMVGDTIGFENEKLGQPLLAPYIKNGKPVRKLPTLDEIRSYVKDQLAFLPDKLKQIDQQSPYPVTISQSIEAILDELRAKHGVKK